MRQVDMSILLKTNLQLVGRFVFQPSSCETVSRTKDWSEVSSTSWRSYLSYVSKGTQRFLTIPWGITACGRKNP